MQLSISVSLFFQEKDALKPEPAVETSREDWTSWVTSSVAPMVGVS
jgi:hypothetical protein